MDADFALLAAPPRLMELALLVGALMILRSLARFLR